MRSLVAHAGKLFAGNGYWEDQPGPEGYQNAQVLVLSQASGKWSIDTNFGSRALATSAMGEVQFTTDGYGNKVSPVSILVASTWDTSGAVNVYNRNDRTNTWLKTQLDFIPPAGMGLAQVRSFGSHVDRVTGDQLCFCRRRSTWYFPRDVRSCFRKRRLESDDGIQYLDDQPSSVGGDGADNSGYEFRRLYRCERPDQSLCDGRSADIQADRWKIAKLEPSIHQPDPRHSVPERVARIDGDPESCRRRAGYARYG